jgi:hypothetical protein
LGALRQLTGMAGCCERATSGHATAALLSAPIKSRRLIGLLDEGYCLRASEMRLHQGFASGGMGLMINLRCKNLGSSMSPLGQKRTFLDICMMSALPPIADIAERHRHVRFVPRGEEVHCSGLYSITSSAVANNISGIDTPIDLDVFKLTTSSNLVGCSTGVFSGLAPRKMLSVISAKRAKSDGKLGP